MTDVDVTVYERLARLETLAKTQADATLRIEKTLHELNEHLDSLRLWKAKIAGVAAASAVAATLAVRFVEAAFK